MPRKAVVPKTKSKAVGGSRKPAAGSPYGNTPKGGRPDNGNEWRDGRPAYLAACPACQGSGVLPGKQGQEPCRACSGSGVAPVTPGSKTPGSV